MNKYCKQWIQNWCQENGWTELFMERREYWAFPPHGVMPMPIPVQALKQIKEQRGMSPQERVWCGAACAAAVSGTILTYLLASPMPLVFAFAFCAVTVAQFEDD
jgi:hypothetical protein